MLLDSTYTLTHGYHLSHTPKATHPNKPFLVFELYANMYIKWFTLVCSSQ